MHQEEVAWRGSAIECRIYAEDPYNDFLPYPGKITRLTRPLGPGIRLDGCVYDGWTVPMEYDPLLAKLAVWAGTREEATARMIRALREYDVGGIRTNIGFFRQILEDPEFRAGHLHTGFIDEFFERHAGARTPPPRDLAAVAALAAALHTAVAQRRRRGRRAAEPPAPGCEAGRKRAAAMKLDLTIERRREPHRDSRARARLPLPPGRRAGARAPTWRSPEPGVYSVLMDGRSYDARVEETPAAAWWS